MSDRDQIDDLIVYRIDAHDQIVHVNDAWDRAAWAFDNSQLSSSIIGDELWRFLGSPAVELLYRELVDDLRLTGGMAVFPYRCDSPEWLRDMEMEVRSLPRGDIEFRSQTLAVVPAPAVPFPHSPPGQVLKVCSWCRSVETKEKWIHLGPAITYFDLFRQDQTPLTSHSICPGCRLRMLGR